MELCSSLAWVGTAAWHGPGQGAVEITRVNGQYWEILVGTSCRGLPCGQAGLRGHGHRLGGASCSQVPSHCAGSHSWVCLLPPELLIPWPVVPCHIPQPTFPCPWPPAQPGGHRAVTARSCRCHIPAVPSILGVPASPGLWCLRRARGSQPWGKCFAITSPERHSSQRPWF